jgi:hypothetical protein
MRRSRVATSGEAWRWADELAPHALIEGRSLATVARALAYQAGLDLRFANAAAEAEAATTTLHGPALDMEPRAALQAILATTSFRVIPQPYADSVVIDTR